jgi:hypothetical protein
MGGNLTARGRNKKFDATTIKSSNTSGGPPASYKILITVSTYNHSFLESTWPMTGGAILLGLSAPKQQQQPDLDLESQLS